MGSGKRVSSMVTTAITAICRCTFSVATNGCVLGCGLRTSIPVPGASRRCNGWSAVAAYADHPASGVRVLPRGTDGLVRKTRGGLRLWLCTEPALAEKDRQGNAPRQERTTAHRRPARVFSEFFYQTHQTWSRRRRFVAQAEQLPGKENPRYVVTSLPHSAWTTQEMEYASKNSLV